MSASPISEVDTLRDTDDLELLRAYAPAAPPPTEDTRSRARAQLARAIAAETNTRRAAWHRTLWRLVPAAGLVALVVGAVLGVVGPAGSSDPGGDAPALVGPRSAGAVVDVVVGEGYTDVHFLDPTADPERVATELAGLGIDLEVRFVPADPFSEGRMVFRDGAEGIDLLGETGSELQGGPIGIRVPDGWSGSGTIGIAREAVEGEIFETSIPLNAERPGGPLHCVPVRGLGPAAAAELVRAEGMKVQWRTLVDGHASTEAPPADFVVQDVLWHSRDTIMLLAGTDAPRPLPEGFTADCARDGR